MIKAFQWLIFQVKGKLREKKPLSTSSNETENLPDMLNHVKLYFEIKREGEWNPVIMPSYTLCLWLYAY